MNYIAAINSFWDSATLNPLSTGQVSLYFALLHINNKSSWTEWFTAPNQVLSILTGLSRSGISKARNELRQRGLIDYKERGTKATAYKITIAYSTQDGVQNGVQNGIQDSSQDGVQDGVQNSSTLNKHKIKLKQEKDTNVSKEAEDKKIDSGVKVRFSPPSVEAVETYCKNSGYDVDAKSFIDFYQSKGWMVGKNPMKDWGAAVRGWASRNRKQGTAGGKTQNRFHNLDEHGYDYEKMMWDNVNQGEGEDGAGG